MIDTIALRSLVAVHRHGTVVAAADALGYTPSAVSQQLKKLESQSGVQLLERLGRGVMLTESGRVLVASAGDLLARMEHIETQLRAGSRQANGTVRLAGFSTAVRGLLAPALAGLRDAAPGVELRMREAEPWDAVDLVSTGQVDIAVVHNWEPVPLTLPDNVHTRVLGYDRADVLVHRDHRLAGNTGVTGDDLTNESWVSVLPGSICHQWLIWMFHERGESPRIAHFAQEFGSHLALVAQGLVTALVPRLGRGPLPTEVRSLPLTDPIPIRRVTALWRRTMTDSPAIGAVSDALAAVSGEVLAADPPRSAEQR